MIVNTFALNCMKYVFIRAHMVFFLNSKGHGDRTMEDLKHWSTNKPQFTESVNGSTDLVLN